jgi:hypothetical protein
VTGLGQASPYVLYTCRVSVQESTKESGGSLVVNQGIIIYVIEQGTSMLVGTCRYIVEGDYTQKVCTHAGIQNHWLITTQPSNQNGTP